MFAVFKNGLVDPPKELHSPASAAAAARSKSPEDALKDFCASHSNNGLSMQFVDKAILAYSPPHSFVSSNRRRSPLLPHKRSGPADTIVGTEDLSLFCGVDDVYCIFMGGLNNLCHLNKQYGLTKCANEALFVIEAYRTLRDRSPIPAHQVLQELEGSFAFVLYDHKYGTVFVALGADKALNLFWGVSADGSLMISDNVDLIKSSCRKSFAPFPTGCMYHSDRGLISYEHPMHKMKAMPRVDSEGAMCGAYFAVDAYSKMNSMPRVGSSQNWATWS